MAADSSQMEEVQGSLVVAWDMEEKVVEDFVREEWAEEPSFTMLMEDLVVVVVLMDMEKVLAAVEGTLVEAVEIMKATTVGEDLITLEQISKMNAVIKKSWPWSCDHNFVVENQTTSHITFFRAIYSGCATSQ